MSAPRYPVTLTTEQREQLTHLIRTGTPSSYQQVVARVLLKLDRSQPEPHPTDQQIADALEISRRTVIRIKGRFVSEGLDATLNRKYPKERPERRRITGQEEAHLIALACGPAPEGRQRWTVRLLADKMVQLDYVETVSYETVRQALKKNELKPWLKQQWCIPSAGAEFVWRMEDVLDVYCRPYNPRRPLICMDEMGKNLVADKRPPLAMKPGQPRREDYTYEKKGASNVFIACEPLAGKRYLKVTKRRTKKDWAHFIKELVTSHYCRAEKIVVVMDNLNTHTPSSLYETFEPAEAKALLDRLELHYTPKHASWLNIAEIELSALVRQGIAHNVATVQELVEQIEQWQAVRNHSGTRVHWQFTTADARIKLARLYPLFKETMRTAA